VCGGSWCAGRASAGISSAGRVGRRRQRRKGKGDVKCKEFAKALSEGGEANDSEANDSEANDILFRKFVSESENTQFCPSSGSGDA